jgi:3-methyladenine DNA glycosylase AlkD
MLLGMVSTRLAGTMLDRLATTYSAAADPAKAGPMRAYMRDQFPFLGIRGPEQRLLTRQVLAGLERPDEADLRDIALGCWDLPEREYQYFAADLLRRHIRVCSAAFLDTARHLIVTRSWWDTVDVLAAHVVGPLVSRYPELVSTMDEWSAGSELWLVRTAILHQLRYREATDATRLLRYCTAQAGHPDFFIRKAIGWALREYAKTAPDTVRAYVRAHESRLSALSVREALRNV